MQRTMDVWDKCLMRSVNASLLLVGHQINSAEAAAISVRHSTLTCNFIFPTFDSFSTCCNLFLASHVISQFFFILPSLSSFSPYLSDYFCLQKNIKLRLLYRIHSTACPHVCTFIEYSIARKTADTASVLLRKSV